MDPQPSTALTSLTWPEVVQIHVCLSDDPDNALLVKPSVTLTNMVGERADNLVAEIMHDLRWDKPSHKVRSLRKDQIAEDCDLAGRPETSAFMRRIEGAVEPLVNIASDYKSNFEVSIDFKADLRREKYFAPLDEHEANQTYQRLGSERQHRNLDLSVMLTADGTGRMFPQLTARWKKEGLDQIDVDTMLLEVQASLDQQLEKCHQITVDRRSLQDAPSTAEDRLAGSIKVFLESLLSNYAITSQAHLYTLQTRFQCRRYPNASNLVFSQWEEHRRLDIQGGLPPNHSSAVQLITDNFDNMSVARRP